MAEIVIGVDGGTTAVKAVAFNLSGDVVSTRRESVSVTYGDHGEAEQDMNQILEAVATCIRSVADVLDPADDVVAIGCTLVLGACASGTICTHCQGFMVIMDSA